MNLNEFLKNAPKSAHGSELSRKEPDCPLCNDTGYIVIRNAQGELSAHQCECVTKRHVMRLIRRSGLESLLDMYRLDNYETPKPWQKAAKEAVEKYLSDAAGWFFICGKPGSGKTHLCTAICGKLIEGGKDLRYMLWREDAPRLKALVNEREEYEAAVNDFKRCSVLYIDDFFKGTVTDADVNLAFEILNSRYNDPHKKTVISGERTLDKILEIDEAIGSRIYQRSEGYRIRTDDVNWRLK